MSDGQTTGREGARLRLRLSAAAPYLMIAVTWALIELGLMIAGGVGLQDTDSFMRLVRIEQLVRDHDWYSSFVGSDNHAVSIDLHWTRPFDVLLLGASIPLLFMGWETALYWAGIILSPILYLASVLTLPWAVAPLAWRSPMPVMAAFIAQLSILPRGVPGRADHHSLQMLLFVVLLGVALRAIKQGRASRLAWGVAAGVIAGLGVWVSVEMLVPALILGIVLGFLWVSGDPAAWRVLASYAAGIVGVLAIALPFEYAPADLLSRAYDKISVVHVFAVGVSLLCWLLVGWVEHVRPAGSRLGRAARLGAIGIVLVLIVAVVVPKLLRGPSVDVDPRLYPVWLDLVGEMQPLWPFGGTPFAFWAYGAAAIICVPFATWFSWRTRPDGRGWMWGWLLALHVVFLLLTAQHIRSGLFLGITTAVILGSLIEVSYARFVEQLQFPLRHVTHVALLTAVLVSFPVLSLVTAASGSSGTVSRCDLASVTSVLDDPQRLGKHPLVIASLIDYGPELMYLTSHQALSGPYHRNHETILDTRALFTATSDAAARAIIERWDVGLLLICGTGSEATFFHRIDGGRTLYERLVSGEVPSWLREVPSAGVSPDQIKLFEVSR